MTRPAMSPRNNRILLIDDSPSIHDDFRKILEGRREEDALRAAEEQLFGIERACARSFDVHSAYQGREGLRMLEAALEAGRPYAMAFVDMRMPPGWDGLETIAHLWEADPRLQVVICTAYSEHSWDEVLERLDVRDRLLVVKKPFDLIEVGQVAQMLTTKWSLAQQAAEHLQELEETVRQLRSSQSALVHARRELQSFAHSVAHDLRSPLAIVRSFGELLAGELQGASGRAAHFLHRIQTNVGVAQDLLDGLCTLTHVARAELRLEEVDLGVLVQQIIVEREHAEPARRVRVEVAKGLRAYADARLIHTVVRNLVENAWKFTSRREHGCIEVGLEEEDDEQATYFVRDNGCGFDMAHADKLFRTFRRLHTADEYPGTGVGLVTVSRVLERHGGRIWADSLPGYGSTFYFLLPKRNRRSAAPRIFQESQL